MTFTMTRRKALGFGGTLAGGTLLGTGLAVADALNSTEPADKIANTYAKVTEAAGGTWSSMISLNEGARSAKWCSPNPTASSRPTA
ncbi:hypothetical protein [Thermocrispum municipale]|uniref:hypothetical protein n=1 Tax=Thermocrispum municipale TaxID=37926 RepID=UPI000424F7FC|nr:hypothetical protein [Thermocrispum municipale]